MNLTELLQKKTEMDAMMKEHGKAAIIEELKGFFAQNPAIRAVVWRQYTPHFNDGDVCEFGIHGVNFIGADGDEDDFEDYSAWNVTYAIKEGKAKPWETAELAANMKRIETLIQENEDACKAAFGDGYQIKATANGVEVEEYDHD